jgi:YD repeat-containing protein
MKQYLMKLFFTAAFIVSALVSSAQYYYKDLIGTKETNDLFKNYLKNKVTHVTLNAYDAENTKSDDFLVEQQFSPASRSLTTFTRSYINNGSVLTSYADDQGDVIRSVDSSNTVTTTTLYQYNSKGQLISTSSTSTDTSSTSRESEEHLWEYSNNKPVRMIRIKDHTDTTYVEFKTDENGNVTEEREIHKGAASEPVYYYYDALNRLTDIVRYNNRAKRLLPEYMFEYSPDGQLIQKITVPANNSNYLIWRYQYDDRGLKIKEHIYNKQKQLTGKIEYQYSFS